MCYTVLHTTLKEGVAADDCGTASSPAHTSDIDTHPNGGADLVFSLLWECGSSWSRLDGVVGLELENGVHPI